jgi:hypothetical protein
MSLCKQTERVSAYVCVLWGLNVMVSKWLLFILNLTEDMKKGETKSFPVDSYPIKDSISRTLKKYGLDKEVRLLYSYGIVVVEKL